MLPVKGEHFYSRCHLDSRLSRALSGILTYPRQLTHAHALQNTQVSPLTAPSAVHLTNCFTPDSQQRRLSVLAYSPLSPLQRFLFGFSHYMHYLSVCQGLLRNLCTFVFSAKTVICAFCRNPGQNRTAFQCLQQALHCRWKRAYRPPSGVPSSWTDPAPEPLPRTKRPNPAMQYGR